MLLLLMLKWKDQIDHLQEHSEVNEARLLSETANALFILLYTGLPTRLL